MASESGEGPLSPGAGEARHGADPVHTGQGKQQLHRCSPVVLLRSSTSCVMFGESLSHSEPHLLLCKTGIVIVLASQEALVVKKPPASAGGIRELGSIPGSGRSLGGGNDNPLQYSCLGNPAEEPGRLHSMGSQRVRHN